MSPSLRHASGQVSSRGAGSHGNLILRLGGVAVEGLACRVVQQRALMRRSSVRGDSGPRVLPGRPEAGPRYGPDHHNRLRTDTAVDVAMRRRIWLMSGAVALLLASTALVAFTVVSSEPPAWDGPVVAPVAQTPPAYGVKDAADDPAIWVHHADPSLSLVIGTNKRTPGGLQVFDLQGRERQFLRTGELNNVDLRDEFPFPDGPGALVAASNRSDNTISFFRVHPRARALEEVASLPTGLRQVYGLCLYRSHQTERLYAFVSSEQGHVGQFEIFSENESIAMARVRTFEVGGKSEGCVADDEHGALYLTREARGLVTLPAEPEATADLELLDEAGTDDRTLVPDVEGVTIYDSGGGDGYVVVSSQGNSTFAVYERGKSHRYLGSFAVTGSTRIDGATSTDGIAVSSVALGENFPAGLLVVHDQDNETADTSNFKYVSWADVADVLDLDEAAPSAG